MASQTSVNRDSQNPFRSTQALFCKPCITFVPCFRSSPTLPRSNYHKAANYRHNFSSQRCVKVIWARLIISHTNTSPEQPQNVRSSATEPHILPTYLLGSSTRFPWIPRLFGRDLRLRMLGMNFRKMGPSTFLEFLVLFSKMRKSPGISTKNSRFTGIIGI
jgi:hypothetical protein